MDEEKKERNSEGEEKKKQALEEKYHVTAVLIDELQVPT